MNRRSWILMAVLAATWGASYLFIKVGLRDFSPGFIVFARTAMAGAILLPVAARAGALGTLHGHGRDILALAAVQVTLPFLLITFGERHVASSLAGILVASAPIFAAGLSFLYPGAERMKGWGLAGIAVGLVGVALLFGVDLSGDTAALIGGLMVLLAGFGYALAGFELKRRLPGVPPAAVAGATMSLSAVLTLPLAVATPPHSAGPDSIAALLALGALGTGLAFLIFYTLISELGPGRASLVAYLAPAFSLLYGTTLLGEPVTLGAIAGLVLILAGSYLGAQGRLPWRRPVPA